MKKILNIACFILLGIVIVLNLFSIVSIHVLRKDYINFFGYTYFEVQSGSMASTININDIIIVKLDEKYKKGDIITYKSNGSFITHRIIEINKNQYITKGDAIDSNDKPTEKKQIIGKVIKIFSGFGVVTRVIQNPITLIFIFVIGVLIIIYSSFKKTKE